MNVLRSVRWLLLAAAVVFTAAPSPAQISIGISVNFGPPVLPVYVQPPCPAPNLIWTPGHWQWDPDFGDYFWVPGAWVPAPYIGAMWTPGYWGWSNGVYMWNAGYWGPHIGYYGGVNYGGGYMGIGFAGGAWNGGVFAYNTAVVNVNRTTITNVYVNETIVKQTTIVNVNHVAYSGGPGGIQHQATPEEQIAAHETHVPPTKFQVQHQQAAQQDKTNFSKNNGGHPTQLAVAKPLAAEPHPAPAGFHPAPPKPVSELAKAQAPPSVQHAAVESSNKSVQEAKAHPPAPIKQTSQPAAAHAATPPPHPNATSQPHPSNPPPHANVQPNAQPHPSNPPPPRPTAQPHVTEQPHPQPHPSSPPPPRPMAQPHPSSPPPPRPTAQPHPQQPHPQNPPPPKPKKPE